LFFFVEGQKHLMERLFTAIEAAFTVL